MYFVETNFQSQQDQWTIFGFEIERKNYDLRLEFFWGRILMPVSLDSVMIDLFRVKCPFGVITIQHWFFPVDNITYF